MNRSLRVRVYRETDLAALVDLWRSVFGEPAAHNNPSDIIVEKCRHQPEFVFVAELDGALVGSVLAGYDGHRGWLNLLAVHPEFRSRGFGRMLVDYAIERLRARGCRKVNLQIRSDNQDVVEFYQQLGFEVEARVSMGLKLTD